MNRTILLSSLLISSLTACVVDDGTDVENVETVEAAATTVTVYRSTQKGGSVDAAFGDELAGGNVSAWQSGTQVSLGYSTYAVDPTSRSCVTESTPEGNYEWCGYSRYSYEYGWGSVPASALTIKTGIAILAATVAPSDSFWIERCTVDYGNAENPYVCTTGAGGGTISVDWSRDGVSSSSWTGTNRGNYGKYSYHSQGQGSWQSATATGSLFGNAFANAGGGIARSSGTSISKDVISNPKPVR